MELINEENKNITEKNIDAVEVTVTKDSDDTLIHFKFVNAFEIEGDTYDFVVSMTPNEFAEINATVMAKFYELVQSGSDTEPTENW